MKRLAAVLTALVIMCTAASVSAYSGVSSWAQTEVAKAYVYSLIPDILTDADMSKPITRLEFAAVGVRFYEAFGGYAEAAPNPFKDTVSAEAVKAYHMGITNGTAADKFSPDELISREQAATMLARLYLLINDRESAETEITEPFADDSEISGWAREGVYFIYSKGIMSGIGDNKFAPQNTTAQQAEEHYADFTREQSLAAAVRMYEKNKLVAVRPNLNIAGIEQGSGQTDEDDKDLFEYIPTVDFGTEIDRFSDDSSATLTLKDVDFDDCMAYIRKMDEMYPTNIYLLDETNYSKKSTNGKRRMTVTWNNGDMSIVIEKEI